MTDGPFVPYLGSRAEIEIKQVARWGLLKWQWNVEPNTETGCGSYGWAWSRERAIRKARRWIARQIADRDRRESTREVIEP